MEPSITPDAIRGRLLLLFFLVVLVGIFATPFLLLHFAYKSSIKELEYAAVAATPVVDAVYDYRKARGSWPPQLDGTIKEFTSEMSAQGWKYNSADDSAELRLHGDMHMNLLFVFVDPSEAIGSPDWTCTMEGSPVPFHVRYQLRDQ